MKFPVLPSCIIIANSASSLENISVPYSQNIGSIISQSLSLKNSYPLALIKDYGYQFIKRRIFKNSLMMYENEAELLRYVYQLNPTLYQEIATEIPERFIPDDLKEKTNAH